MEKRRKKVEGILYYHQLIFKVTVISNLFCQVLMVGDIYPNYILHAIIAVSIISFVIMLILRGKGNYDIDAITRHDIEVCLVIGSLIAVACTYLNLNTLAKVS